MSSIGQGGPGSPLKEAWPAPMVVWEALSRLVSAEKIGTVRTQTGRHSQRIRRLPATAVVWLMIDGGHPLSKARSHKPALVWAHAARANTSFGPPAPSHGSVREAPPQRNAHDGHRRRAFNIPDTTANASAFGRPGTRPYVARVDGGYPQIHVTFPRKDAVLAGITNHRVFRQARQ